MTLEEVYKQVNEKDKEIIGRHKISLTDSYSKADKNYQATVDSLVDIWAELDIDFYDLASTAKAYKELFDIEWRFWDELPPVPFEKQKSIANTVMDEHGVMGEYDRNSVWSTVCITCSPKFE